MNPTPYWLLSAIREFRASRRELKEPLGAVRAPYLPAVAPGVSTPM
jgi:hypothetical protein